MEDVLQEAYLKAFRALPRLKGDARALRSWLMRIVYNAGIDELRRARRRPSVSLDETRHDHTVEVADDAGDRELEAALEALPAEGRAVVLLVDVYGFDYRETARVLGIREGTVGSRLHRARRELRAAIEEEGGVP